MNATINSRTGCPDVHRLTAQQLASLELAARNVRGLALDAVYRARSGHLGLPLGCAELGVYLYSSWLRHTGEDQRWPNRDRFILSAGHGSLLLYACLHLSGYPLSLEDLQHFRQLGSPTPSHPELGTTPGIEATTGVDGQGVGFGAGQALALKLMGNRLGQEHQDLLDAKVVVLAGDGCLMEGISAEASSLAGHLGLNNLIVIFDSNQTTLDGFASESCSEDIKGRYQAYGWDVKEIDGHNFTQIHRTLYPLRDRQERPTLIVVSTTIGCGLVDKSGTPQAHGGEIGEDEWRQAKLNLGFRAGAFSVDEGVYEFFKSGMVRNEEIRASWEQKIADTGCKEILEQYLTQSTSPEIDNYLAAVEFPSAISGRGASHMLLQELASKIPWLIGGSADLARSDGTRLDLYPAVEAGHFSGRNIKFGVREFAMGAMACGIALTRFFLPFIGTYLAFSDYCRSAIRMTALMRQRVIFQLTHDSVFIGQDGPTHQPVEQMMSLRLIPNLLVIRPADGHEVARAWIAALRHQGPTALILARQSLPLLKETKVPFEEGVGRGAYWLVECKQGPGYVLVATGSEVAVALDVVVKLQTAGINAGVISMPCWELFDAQEESYRKCLFWEKEKRYIAIEAGTGVGWERYVGSYGSIFSIDRFGSSGDPDQLAKHFGLQPEQIFSQIIRPIHPL